MQPKERATIIFADICQSTRLYETLGDTTALKVVQHTLKLMSDVVAANGGIVLRTLGDEVFCIFPGVEPAVQSACRMHQVVTDDTFLAHYTIALRIGLNEGEVLHDKDDVYGDAVNLAAKLAGIAKAGQIITTADSVAGLTQQQNVRLRSLGLIKVSGKQERIRINEIIWQDETPDLTIMPGNLTFYASHSMKRLEIKYEDVLLQVGPERDVLRIGREDHNDLVVAHDLVSRKHAVIHFRRGKFIFEDRSSNGSYIHLESGERLFLHREEFLLHNRGVISLGQTTTAPGTPLIHFSCCS